VNGLFSDLRQPDFARQRQRMVAEQLRRRGIHDERVLAAMGAVPRERFVPRDLRPRAYDDSALPIGEGQTISQPYMVARTCELAHLTGGDNVLEVGSGSGYQAAVLGEIGAHVVGIERIDVLGERSRVSLSEAGYDNVEIVIGDGSLGYLPRAPYDRIVVAAAAPTIPKALVEQLVEGGRLVIPVGPRYMQKLQAVEKRNGQLVTVDYDACVFVPLVGEQGWEHE